MDIASVLREEAARTTKVVERVRTDQLRLPTPCTSWDVRSLINHLCMSHRFCARVAAGERAEPDYDTDFVGDDASDAYRRARDEMLEACTAPGVAERMVHMGHLGEMPGEMILLLALADTVVHRWDLSQAVGIDFEVDDDVATFLLERSEAVVQPEMRAASPDLTTGTAPFGPSVEVGDETSPADRLVAFLGREPSV